MSEKTTTGDKPETPQVPDDGGQPSGLRLVLALGMTGLFSGLVLVGAFLATEPRIRRNRAEALQEAIFKVLPGTTEFSTYVLRDETLVPWDGEPGVQSVDPTVYAGRDEAGRLVGYAVPATGSGFMDSVGLIYGLETSRRVILGMEVLESRETPGLGDKIASDPQFKANFEALAVDPTLEPVKHGTKRSANEVDCITGATISSESVVKILNRSVERWLPLLERLPAGEGRDER